MRLLLVLFACVAAANALSYSYDYYCSRNFYVFPASSCYHYTVYFPSTWCSSSYYAPILKVYPGDNCGTSSFQEKTPDQVVSEMRNLLNAALSKMTSQMYSKRNAWLSHLDSVHAQFKSYFKNYIYRYYTYRHQCGYFVGVNYIKQRNDRISAYYAQLDKLRNDVLAKFNAAIAEKIKAVKKYHDEILKQGQTCLNTRVSKIGEFRKSILTKVRDGVAKFAKLHIAILNKKRDYYKDSLFYTIGKCTDFWTYIKGAISVSYYYSQERRKVENFVRIYALKLATHHRQLLKVYTCSYKCYMYSGSIQFFKKSYYQQCKQIGTWTTYKTNYGVSKYCVSPFTYTWRSACYKNLKTCDVNADSRNSASVISSLKKQRDDILKANDSKFYSWKSTWVGYNLRYKAEFEKIVRQRHSWYCGYVYQRYITSYGCVTSVQTAYLSQLKSDLKKKAEEVCRKFYSNLVANIVAACNTHRASQAAFKKNMDTLISKLQAKYNECASKRSTAIVDYEKKMKAKRDEMRAKLVSSITTYKNNHYDAFKKMLSHYFGTSYSNVTILRYLFGCYCYRIERKVAGVISQFDSYWNSILPKLVHHITCGYKCSISAKIIPRYSCGGFYSWTYKLPTYYSYSYQLSCYRMYYR